MYRVFIVEDDAVIAAELRTQLTAWGLEVTAATDFMDILPQFRACRPHVVLLDISLPFYNGFHWCRQIRREARTPVVFLSSAADNMNIVMAMDMGGDDFIAKPFDMRVLTAKLQAILRRSYDLSMPVRALTCAGAELNTADASLLYQGRRVELTKNEYRILEALMEQKGRIVSRDRLMEHLWQTDSFVDENTLTVNIARLRRKLEAAGLCDFITTKKGMGYMVAEP